MSRIKHSTLDPSLSPLQGSRTSELLIAASTLDRSASNDGTFELPGQKFSLSGPFAVDMANAPVSFVNNLEADQAYSHWVDMQSGLFTPDFTGGVRRLRRNLHNVVLVMDPLATEGGGREMVRLVEAFLLHKTAVR